MGKTRDTANLISDGNLSVDIVNDRVGIGSTIPASQLNVSSGPVIVGSGSSTGTTSQPLQVTGGAYVSGSVGVGYTKPISKLEVGGDIGFVYGSGIYAGREYGPTSEGGNNTWSSGTSKLISVDWTGSRDRVRIYTPGSLSSTEKITILSSDNVGIATTNPVQNLHVNGNFLVAAGTSTGQHIIQKAYELNSGTLSWEGSAGQLFSITNNLTSGSIFSVNDVSGIPSIDVDANGTIELGPYGGDTQVGGIVENVSTATTYMVGNAMVLEMDVRKSTVYTYTMPTGANIGIVSFRNMPATTGISKGSTVTLLVTQNSVGTGNTTGLTGIGTNCTVVGYENGTVVAGISTRGLVGSGTTVTLSSTGSDVDFVSFFIQYTGGTNTVASSYKVYVTKNGAFRRGNVGV